MTLSLLICFAGLFIWLIFTKSRPIADSWVSELGKLCFFAGLLAYLLQAGAESVL